MTVKSQWQNSPVPNRPWYRFDCFSDLHTFSRFLEKQIFKRFYLCPNKTEFAATLLATSDYTFAADAIATNFGISNVALLLALATQFLTVRVFNRFFDSVFWLFSF